MKKIRLILFLVAAVFVGSVLPFLTYSALGIRVPALFDLLMSYSIWLIPILIILLICYLNFGGINALIKGVQSRSLGMIVEALLVLAIVAFIIEMIVRVFMEKK